MDKSTGSMGNGPSFVGRRKRSRSVDREVLDEARKTLEYLSKKAEQANNQVLHKEIKLHGKGKFRITED